jgi:hypothetical protein
VQAVAAHGADALVPVGMRAAGITGAWRRRACHGCTIADTVVTDVRARFVMLACVAACRLGFEARERPGDGGTDEASDGAVDAMTDAANPANVVFVTSTTVDLCAGGVAAADAECAARALAGGLSGTFVSWTSDATSDARDRLGTAAGWERVDGRPVASNLDLLLTSGPWFPPRLDENGIEIAPTIFVSSATGNNGRLSGNNPPCNIGGRPTHTGTNWYGGILVGPPNHVVCFGIDRNVPVTAPVATGRIAFATTASFVPSGGIAAADALCASEAGNASLPGTYKAFMSTTTVPAASRFNLSAAPWVRTDGVPLMESASHLATWRLLTAVDRHADGSLAQNFAWTGNPTTNTMAQTCNDWSTASSTVFGVVHITTESASSWTTFQNGCATNGTLICFQE